MPPPTPRTPGKPSRGKPDRPAAPPLPGLELYVEEGDVVEWYSGGNPGSKPWPATVTKLGIQQIDVVAITPAVNHRDGVWHMSNPRCREAWNRSGGWRHRRLTIALRAMAIRLGLLEWQLQANNEWALACTVIEHEPEPKPPEAPAKAEPKAPEPPGSSPLGLE